MTPPREPQDGTTPAGRYMTLPGGERIFMLDDPPEGGPPPAVVPLDQLGTFVTDEEGRTVFRPHAGLPLSGLAPEPAAPPPAAAPPSPLEAARGGFLPSAAAPAPAPSREPDPGRWTAEPLEAPGSDGMGEAMQEIISSVPGRVARWGIGAICGVFAVLLALAALVRYPEVVSGTATVTTPAPPVRVSSATGGLVQQLRVAENQVVAPGDVLAVLAGSADFGDVQALRAVLARTAPGAPLEVGRALALGDIQQPFTAYGDAVAQARTFAEDPFYAPQLHALRVQAAGQESVARSSAARIALLEDDAVLATRAVERSREMVRRQLLSVQEAEHAETQQLARRQAVQAGRSEAAAQRLRAVDASAQVLALEQRRHAETARLAAEVRKTHSALAEAVREWEVRFLLRAPVAGRVTFFRGLAEGQYAAAGEPLLAVVPGSGRPTATVLVAEQAAPRVRVGQRVLIRFESYPAQRFGTVRGEVVRIALVPDQPPPGDRDGTPRYRVGVALPWGLRTTSGRQLELRQEMAGTAEIVTANRTVLGRFLSKVAGER